MGNDFFDQHTCGGNYLDAQAQALPVESGCTVTRTQSSVRLRSLELAVCASALILCGACSEQAVLDLFPGAGTGDCSDTAAPGAAGAAGAANGCLDYQAALVHRYSFNTLGVIADDRIGTAHGSIVNAMITGSGKLDLAGAGSDQYVNLPNGLIGGLEDATFEAWVNWNGGGVWQRIFDFGTSYEGEGLQGSGSSYLFLTPKHIYGPLRLAYSVAGAQAEIIVDADVQLPIGTTSHVVAVVDDTHDMLSLYLDGRLQGSVAFQGQLSAIDDVNNWLGRSQFVIDDELGATLYEFRVYAAALTETEIAASYAAGPDPVSLEP